MRKHIVRLILIFLVVGLIAYFFLSRPDRAELSVAAVSGARPEITKPRKQLIPTVSVADAVGWPQGAAPRAVQGLAVNAFARGLDHPRWMTLLDNGDVLVAEANSPPREAKGIAAWVMGKLMGKAGAGVPSANRITLLRDADGDGTAEARSVLIGNLASPFGMAVTGGYLYIGNHNALVRVPFTPGQTKITATPEKVIDLPGGGNHWARNVIANADGSRLYVTVGSSSNIAENGLEAETNRATILEVDPATKTFRIFAAGLRNPNGLAWEPASGRLWTTVNERDMLGSDLTPDYMTAVDFGAHYGWPWYYWSGYPDPRVEPANPALQEYVKRPDYALGPHTASLGLAFADDVRLGQRFARGAFIGQHGSWNRVPVSGYKVVYVPFAANGFPPAGVKPIDVLTGFLNKDGEAMGRPVGVIGDRSGAMLVADDVGNVIWRVSAPAAAQTPAR